MRYGHGRVIFSNAIHTLLRRSLDYATSALKTAPRIRIAEHTELLTDSITPLDTSTLRQNVRPGRQPGRVIRHSAGEHVFKNIEGIRQASKSAKDAKLTEALFKQLRTLDSQQLHLIARVLRSS